MPSPRDIEADNDYRLGRLAGRLDPCSCETVGSPAYVRCLRDQAAISIFVKVLDDEDCDVRAVAYADALIRVLGYKPLGEPGKEG